MTDAPQVEARWHAASPARMRLSLALAVTALLLLVVFVIYASLGPAGTRVNPLEVGRVFANHVPLLDRIPHADPDLEADTIIWQLRLPRAFTAMLIGALLGLAGVALQGLLMNPLADPYTVGVSAGAAVGAAIAEVLGIAGFAWGLAGPGMAFAFALAAVAFVYALASLGGRVSVHTFLLAGVVVGTFLWSLIPLLMTLARRSEDMARIMFYLIGTVQGADWPRAGLLLPFLLTTTLCLRVWARDLNLMTFGEESAAHLGVEIESFKRRVLLIGSLATAAAVSAGGIIGFVGLVVPHVARRFVGPDHRSLIPLTAMMGALLMLASDLLVRVWLNEMPVGVVTSLVGAPVFCYLLRRRRAVAW